MKIFVDESGTFVTRADGTTVGAVGALVITESQLEGFERRYAQLRPLLPKERGEVKGRNLREEHIARVVDVARRSGLIYEVTVIDLLPNNAADLEAHRTGQCEGLTGKLTDEHHPDLVTSVWALRRRLEAMPLQLYAQCTANFDVLWRTLRYATLYYSLREPRALARFQWIIDAKATAGATDWEDWWSSVMRPMMQARSLRVPFAQMEGGDYSYFAANEVPAPRYLVREFPELEGRTVLNVRAGFAFSDTGISGFQPGHGRDRRVEVHEEAET